MTRRKPAAPSMRAASAALVLTFAGSLSACVQYASSDPGLSADPAVRHPIVLASAPTTLDVYPVGGRLDARSRSEIAAFAQRYRRCDTRGQLDHVRPIGETLGDLPPDQAERGLDGHRGGTGVEADQQGRGLVERARGCPGKGIAAQQRTTFQSLEP